MKLLKLKKIQTGKHPYKDRIYFTTYGLYRCPHCGAQKWLKPSKAKQTKSCGCLTGGKTHGLGTHHPLYHSWCGMRQRCGNPKCDVYSRYGGRGIKVCKAWTENFLPFYHWGIKHGWKPGLTLERKNNNAGYSPGNCCFITRGRQARNRRPNKLNDQKVSEIRTKYAAGARVCDLAKAYKVSDNTVCRTVHHHIWKG